MDGSWMVGGGEGGEGEGVSLPAPPPRRRTAKLPIPRSHPRRREQATIKHHNTLRDIQVEQTGFHQVPLISWVGETLARHVNLQVITTLCYYQML